MIKTECGSPVGYKWINTRVCVCVGVSPEPHLTEYLYRNSPCVKKLSVSLGISEKLDFWCLRVGGGLFENTTSRGAWVAHLVG